MGLKQQMNPAICVATDFSSSRSDTQQQGLSQQLLRSTKIAVLGERGLSAAAAATNFLPQSVASALVALVVGRLVDRVPSRIVVPFSMLTLMIAVLRLPS